MNRVTIFRTATVVAAIVAVAMVASRFLVSESTPEPPPAASVSQADSLIQLAEEELTGRNTKPGEALARQALEIARRSGYRQGEIKALIKLGYALSEQARYDTAIVVLREARSLAAEVSMDQAQRGLAAQHLGSCYLWKGEYEAAKTYLNEALRFYLKDVNNFGIAAVHNQLGIVYAQQAMYAEAQAIWEKGLVFARKVAEDRYYERSMIGNLGILYRVTGQIDRAVPLIEQSLRMGREMKDRRAQAVDLRNLGDITLVRGNFRLALRQYAESARLREEIGNTRALLLSYASLGEAYDLINDFDNAEFYYDKGIELIRTRLGGKFQEHPELYRSYAMHCLRTGELDKADKLVHQALAGYETLNLRNDLINGYLTLAELRLRQGKVEESLTAATTAFELGQQIDTPYRPKTYLERGRVLAALGENDSARAYLERAVELSADLKDPEVTWQAHYQLAQVFEKAGELVKAVAHDQKALAAIEDLRRYTIAPGLGSSFLADKVGVYHHLFDLLYVRYRQKPKKETLEALFRLAERTRSRSLLDNLSRGYETVFVQLRESSALQNLEQRMVSVNRMLRDERLKRSNEQRKDLIRSWEGQLVELRRDYRRLSSQLAAANPQLSALIGVSAGASIRQLQSLLDDQTALLSYYISAENVYVFVITAAKGHLSKVQVTAAGLWDAVHRLRKPFQDFKQGRLDFGRLAFDVSTSKELFRNLVAPLQPDLQKISKLAIIPGGALNYLPFELLVSGRQDTTAGTRLFAEVAQYRFLIEDFTIGYLPSAALMSLLAKPLSQRPPEALLAFGNPVSSPQVKHSPLLALDSPPSGLRGLVMSPLPAASIEVQRIAALYGGTRVQALTGSAASEAVYKSEAQRFRYIHFATHGYADERNPSFSALLLNPGNSDEDGLLYAYEIYAHPLQAEMVSLSACETAMGRLVQGEGLVSLVQAFFVARSRSVMASLWSVEESTYPLMVSFYRRIKEGTPAAEALRQAKLEFMKGFSRRGEQLEYSHRHPFLWAPFVFYGLP